MNVLPLPIYPWPITDEQMGMLKRAKAEADVPFLVYPQEALPGGPGRVLAIGQVPDFACDAVYIQLMNVTRYESIRDALHYWLKGEEVPPTVSMESWLSAVMGCEVKMIGEEERDAR